MKKVLMIIYHFPPMGGSGVHRSVKFAKYLSDFGWEPIILTVDEKRPEDNDDKSLLNELPDSIKIYRSGYIGFKDLLRFSINKGINNRNISDNESSQKGIAKRFIEFTLPLIIPDPKIGWCPFAIRKAKRIFQENTIDFIYSTSPFPTAHIVAMSLAKKYCKPWVVDFRDPWTKFFFVKRPFPFKQLERAMEKRVLKKADKIVIAWPGIQDNFKLQYKNYNSQKTVIIHNGFDEQDFQNITPKTFSKFTIVYAGVFYKDRTPEALFKAISNLLIKKPSIRKDVQIIHVGRDEPFVTNLIEAYDLSDIFISFPHLPHQESLSYILGADVLYLNTVQNYIPGKTYEYLRSRKPILTLVSKDKTVSELVNSTRSGIVIDPSETQKIVDTILGMYKKYKNGELNLEREDDSIIYEFERKNLTSKLAEIFNEITERNENLKIK